MIAETVAEIGDLTGLKLGNYRLERLLGRGRMGVVYLATDEALLRKTAVKVLSWSIAAPPGHDPEAWFLAEARSVARVNHPAVVQIYSVARHGAYRYIAMEYVDGVSADQMVATRGPFAPDRATEVVAEIAGGLDLAHQAGLVHRDVKPANVLIACDGRAKLGDFGMAMHVDGSAPRTERAGTPHYIAPEVWNGAAASPASDLYALGATYFYLLAGRPPFGSSDLRALAAEHVGTAVPPVHELRPGVPAQCSTIIWRCMAKAPGDRYPTAQELKWELRGLLRTLDALPTQRPSGEAASVLAPYPADAEWTGLGFALQPFGDVDPRRPPYEGEPFLEVGRRLAEGLASGHPVLLTGAPGSGRTVLAHQALARRTCGPGAYLDAARPPAGRSLAQRLARAFGVLPTPFGGPAADLDALVDHLRLSLPAGATALVVVDGLAAERCAIDELARVARAGFASRTFTVLVVGDPDLATALDAASYHGEPIEVPPLALADTPAYLDSWLRAARAAGAAPTVISADAALLAGHRARGNLRHLGRLAANMIRLAARRGGRVVSSWEAWAAAADAAAATDGAVRPAEWPTAEVKAILNGCRREIGRSERA